MLRNTNQVVSIFRNTQTVESLRRIHNVTGTEFPVSGDAPLRYAFQDLKAKMDHAAALHYADTDSLHTC